MKVLKANANKRCSTPESVNSTYQINENISSPVNDLRENQNENHCVIARSDKVLESPNEIVPLKTFYTSTSK